MVRMKQGTPRCVPRARRILLDRIYYGKGIDFYQTLRDNRRIERSRKIAQQIETLSAS